MKWWSPPKQRQRWGDTQILPSGTWGQIFFDLFYVGGCINLGDILKAASKSYDNGAYQEALLYFGGTGLSVMMMWFDKMYYDARFTTRPGHDACHRLWDVVQIGIVAVALSRLRSSDVLQNSCEHADMFQLSLALLLNSLSTIGRYLEVLWYGEGDQPAAKAAAKRDIQWRLTPTLCFLLATIDSGYSFYLPDNAECQEVNDRPIWCCWAGWGSWALWGYIHMVSCAPKQGWTESSVPMNVPFCIHRYGEWFMLMFGESIISLLIVDGENEAPSYNVAFFSGILSVIFLAHLHYSGEPHGHMDHHALSRSRHSNYLYTIVVPMYSMALIAVGVSYKLFLYEFTYTSGYSSNNGQRRGLGGGGGYDENYGEIADNNEESQANSYYYDDSLTKLEARKQYAADLFSGSIAAVLLFMDVNQLLHRGLETVRRHARKNPTRLVIFILLKYALVVILATLSTHQTDPHVMAFCGLGAILFEEYLRNFFFQDRKHHQQQHGGNGKLLGKDDDDDDDDDDDLTWLSMTSSFNAPSKNNDESASLAIFERESLVVDEQLSAIAEGDEEGGASRTGSSRTISNPVLPPAMLPAQSTTAVEEENGSVNSNEDGDRRLGVQSTSDADDDNDNNDECEEATDCYSRMAEF